MSKKQEMIRQLSDQFGFSPAAVAHLWEMMSAGQGTMAQFNHPELGGMGQWQGGGMLMIGDMFNHTLKAKVAELCRVLQPLVGEDIANEGDERDSFNVQRWWPREYGQPDASSAQNRVRYAYFAEARRLMVEVEGVRQIYDTGNHRITGFAQQNGALQFHSQLGTFGISELRRVEA